MHGNAKFIKEITKINDRQSFFKHFELQANGQFNINNEITMHPKAFLQLPEEYRRDLLELSVKLKNNEIMPADFANGVRRMADEYRITPSRAQAYAYENFL